MNKVTIIVNYVLKYSSRLPYPKKISPRIFDPMETRCSSKM